MTAAPIDTVAAAATLRTLANPVRLQIALRLLTGPAAVAELERELGLRQPHLSQQLAELRDASLVVARREARSVVYSLAPGRAERLVTAIAQGLGIAPPAHPAAHSAPPLARPQRGAVFATVLRVP